MMSGRGEEEQELEPEDLLRRAVEVTDFLEEFGWSKKFELGPGQGLGTHRDHTPTPPSLHVYSTPSNNMPLSTRMNIFELLRENMKIFYEISGWGWNETEKQKELFHPHSRFLLLTSPSPAAANSDERRLDREEVVGFAMFRFEWDDEDEPEHAVLYLYEVQVKQSLQRAGLGLFLMQRLREIKDKLQLWKILLTCFKTNLGALSFYRKLGFDVDVNSPSRCGYHNESYEILSDRPNLK